jgi:pimeloyl-ACP methyl ester carboxylesterase
MVDLLVALLEQEDLAPALLVGNCMGANIAASLARRRPDLVTGLLALNPLTEASFSGGRIGFLHGMARVAGPPTRLLRTASRRLRALRPIAEASLRFQLGRKGVERGPHRDEELVACQMRRDQLPALVDVLDDMVAYGDLDTEGAPTGVPTWIVWGDENRVLSRRRAAHLHRTMHAERVALLDGCGHLPMLEEPDAVTALIEELFARTAPAPAEVPSSREASA